MYVKKKCFVMSPLLRLGQAKQVKMASKKVDVWGHVLMALSAAGFGSDSTLEVAMCVCMCVRTSPCIFEGQWEEWQGAQTTNHGPDARGDNDTGAKDFG